MIDQTGISSTFANKRLQTPYALLEQAAVG
jgi:hypothetical protein